MIIFTEKLLTNTTGNIIFLAIYAYLSNRAPLTYFTDGGGGEGCGGGGVRGRFLGLKFWPKGIF